MTDETIYVASNGSSETPRTVHADPDCYLLGDARTVVEKDLAVYPPAHRTWCPYCGGTDEPSTDADATRGEAA